ncbi:tagaturonate reductase [Alteromonadaceae bacterium BrNp21-10]|nr:tagaturonate reductase [Alteromonadaceae bacterium BrNp21-10]
MEKLSRDNVRNSRYPTKIMQFGEGNFLRAFVDWQIDHLNKSTDLNAGVAVIRPIDYDAIPLLNVQDGLYTTIIRGLNESGEAVEDFRVIDCINEEIPVYKDFSCFMALAESSELKIIFSNTTEAGIEYIDTDKLDDTPAKAFPAKLTQWLLHRYQHFNGSSNSGLVIIPCELIDYNGEKLKEIVMQYCQLWQLEQGFVDWLENANDFCSSLVDRIVPGFPRDEHQQLQQKLGYEDNFMVTAEYFHLFVIQGPKHLEELLCLKDSELNIKIVDDISPYKERKVAILNGAHTALVPLAYLSDIDTVGDSLADPLIEKYLTQLIYSEIIPTLSLPQDELQSFANDVLNRFRNPYIQHMLMSISLNSMTKFHTRIMPQLLTYVERNKRVPEMMAAALAGQILFYRGKRGDDNIELTDGEKWLNLFAQLWSDYQAGAITVQELVQSVLAAQWHWQQDLSLVSGLTQTVADYLQQMLDNGVRPTLTKIMARI